MPFFFHFFHNKTTFLKTNRVLDSLLEGEGTSRRLLMSEFRSKKLRNSRRKMVHRRKIEGKHIAHGSCEAAGRDGDVDDVHFPEAAGRDEVRPQRVELGGQHRPSVDLKLGSYLRALFKASVCLFLFRFPFFSGARV